MVGVPRSLSRGRTWIVLALVAGLTLGLLVAPVAYEATVQPEPDRIAVVSISGSIDGSNAQDVNTRLAEVRMDGSVEAVVLHLNSPGGLATASEEVFQQVERTSQEKPVVAVVDSMAASGAYKAVLPADEVHAKPASMVGSVGAVFVRPDPVDPMDPVIETGPQKVDGDTPRGYAHSTEIIGNTFSGSVMEYRGDEITLSKEELAHARIYSGIEAAELGLVDEVSDVQGGIQAAADLADVDEYQVQQLRYQTQVKFLDQTTYAASTEANKTMITMGDLTETEGDRIVPSVLFLPHGAVSLAPANTSEAPEEEGENAD